MDKIINLNYQIFIILFYFKKTTIQSIENMNHNYMQTKSNKNR